MKIRMRVLALMSILLTLSLVAAPSRGSVTETTECANQIFAPVLESLRAKTGVPVRLPLIVGGDYDAVLYAEVTWASRARYLVRIGQQCERSFCGYGSVAGTAISKGAARPRGKAVELGSGITGYLVDGSKGSRDSSITWDQDQYRYTITLYASEPANLIKVANSALSCDNH